MSDLTHENSGVILASAGTGKTFRLTMRFIAMLARGQDPSRILVTTFTRAAAGELADRILRILARASLESGVETLVLLQDHADRTLTRERCAQITRTLAHSLHRLHIQTIDSFFARCATGLALELDLPPGWRMLNESEDGALRDEAVERVVHDRGGDEIIELLEAISAGKAESRIAHPLRDEVNRAYSTWLNTPAKAWWSSQHQPYDLSQSDLTDLLRRFDAFPCPRTKQNKEHSSWQKALARIRAILMGGPLEDLATDPLVKRFRDPDPVFNRIAIDPQLVEILQPALGCAEHKILWRLTQRNLGVRDFLDHFDKQYRELKHRAGGVVFDDIPRMLLASDRMDRLETLAYRIDGAIDHVMIDEAQDTSLQQFKLFEGVIDEILASGGVGESTVCIVGDVKQSLYGWRNAEPELLAAVPSRWPHIKQDTMARSYRSSPIVMETVNSVFQTLDGNEAIQEHRETATRWSALFTEHDTTLTRLPGYAALIEATRADRNGQDDEDDLPSDLRDTDGIAIDRITQLHNSAPRCTIGVLYRSSKFIAPMVHALRARGIPACESRGNPLTDTPVVAAVLSLLILSDHPDHSAAAYHVSRTPLGEIMGLTNHRDRAAVAKAAGEWRSRVSRLGYAEALRSLTTALAPHTDLRGMQRYEHLIELTERIDKAAPMSALDFIDVVERCPFESGSNEPVRVMTIHSSKGLEFDAVVLPELDSKWSLRNGEIASLKRSVFGAAESVSLYVKKDLRSLDPALEQIFHYEEGRRISDGLCALYVAMTRAKSALEMIVSPPPKESTSIHAQRILRAALLQDAHDPADPDVEQRIIWSSGDPEWFTNLRAQQDVAHATPRSERSLRLRAGIPGSSWIRSRITPSSLEGGGSQRVDAILKPRPARALDHGTLIHLWLSEIEWLDDPRPTTDQLMTVAREHELDASEEDASQFLALLERDPLREILSANRYRTDSRAADRLIVRLEYPFVRADRRDDTAAIMTGIIDRLVIGMFNNKPAWAEVIDYKTDAINPSNSDLLTQRAEHYRPQIGAYRSACAKMLKLPEDNITCSLVFIEAGAVLDPVTLHTDADHRED